MISDLELKARLRNEIRALALEIDAAAGVNWGTALGSLRRVGFPWLHEASLSDLQLMRGWLLNWLELLSE